MKVKQLLDILKNADPEAVIKVSTAEYYDNFYEAGYKKGSPQNAESVTIDIGKNAVYIDGGK